jgi:hemophore-related protein
MNMSHRISGRRALVVMVGAGAMLLGGGAAIAAAEPVPPPPPPPNCTAADLAGVSTGVTAATSAYLFTHPDVNYFFTDLKGLPRDEMKVRVQEYVDGNPQVKAELQGIRQPMVDFRNRCGG